MVQMMQFLHMQVSGTVIEERHLLNEEVRWLTLSISEF